MAELENPLPTDRRRYTACWTNIDSSLFMLCVEDHRIAKAYAIDHVATGSFNATVTTEVYRDGKWAVESIEDINPEPCASTANFFEHANG